MVNETNPVLFILHLETSLQSSTHTRQNSTNSAPMCIPLYLKKKTQKTEFTEPRLNTTIKGNCIPHISMRMAKRMRINTRIHLGSLTDLSGCGRT